MKYEAILKSLEEVEKAIIQTSEDVSTSEKGFLGRVLDSIMALEEDVRHEGGG